VARSQLGCAGLQHQLAHSPTFHAVAVPAGAGPFACPLPAVPLGVLPLDSLPEAETAVPAPLPEAETAVPAPLAEAETAVPAPLPSLLPDPAAAAPSLVAAALPSLAALVPFLGGGGEAVAVGGTAAPPGVLPLLLPALFLPAGEGAGGAALAVTAADGATLVAPFAAGVALSPDEADEAAYPGWH